MKRISLLLFVILLTAVSASHAQTTAEDYEDYYDKAFYLFHTAKDYEGAIAAATKAIELESKFAHAYFIRGRSKYEKKDYDGAIVDLTKANELHIHRTNAAMDGNGFYWRGMAQYQKRNFDEAIADFTQSIIIANQIDKSDFFIDEAYVFRANAKYEKKDYDGAIADMRILDEIATKIEPHKIEYLLMWAQILKNGKNDYAGAIAVYTEVIKRQPEDAEGYAYRGVARENVKNYDGAIEDFTKAIELNPKDASYYSFRGIVREYRKDYEGAIADYTKAIELDPKRAEYYSNRGDARVAKKDYEGAIADFTKVIELEPKNAEIYSNSGEARRKRQDLIGAISDLTKKIELKPNDNYSFYARSWLYLCMSKGDSAYNDVLKYLEMSKPDDDYRPYAVLNGYFALRQSNKTAAANEFLATWVKKVDQAAFPTQVIRYLGKTISEQQLLILAVDSKDKIRVRGYIGMNESLSGNREAALSHLRWVVANTDESFNLYTLAVFEIKRLEAAGKPK